jgi:hypothetical protein
LVYNELSRNSFNIKHDGRYTTITVNHFRRTLILKLPLGTWKLFYPSLETAFALSSSPLKREGLVDVNLPRLLLHAKTNWSAKKDWQINRECNQLISIWQSLSLKYRLPLSFWGYKFLKNFSDVAVNPHLDPADRVLAATSHENLEVPDHATPICPLPGLGPCVRERCNFWDDTKEECTGDCFQAYDSIDATEATTLDTPCVISFYEDND